MIKKNSWTGVLLIAIIIGSLILTGCSEEMQEDGRTDMKLFENVNITEYGARSDGSSDTVGAVLKVAGKLGKGQAIYFPAGEYLFESSLEIAVPVRIGGNAKIIVSKGSKLVFSGLFAAGEQKIFRGEGSVEITSTDVWGYPSWFDDGNQDSATLIQKAADSLRCLIIPSGNYILPKIVLRNPISLKGVGSMKIKLQAREGTGVLFRIASNDVSFENFYIDMSRSSKDSVCFLVDNSDQNIAGIGLENIEVEKGYTVITDADSPDHAITKVSCRKVTCSGQKSTPIIMRNFKEEIRMTEVSVIRRKQLGAAVDVPGAVIENNKGMILEHFDVNGDIEGLDTEGHGIIFRNCENVSMHRILIEYISGTGFIFENCKNFYGDNVQVYTFYNKGFIMNGLEDTTFNMLKVTYNDLPGSDAVFLPENLDITNSKNLTFNSVISIGSRGASLSLENCSDIEINSYYSENTKGLSVSDEGNNSGIRINGMINRGSGTSIKLISDGICIRAAILGSNDPSEEICEPGNY
ncbi:MAG: glycosyl hydrolase family 28-related protein [Saccharofermentanales bacterium]